MKKLLAIGLLLSFVILPSVSSAQTQTELQQKIAVLLEQIKALQAQVAQLQGQTINVNSCINLLFNLYAEQTDATTNGEVTKLQQFLSQDSSIYPAGLVTGYFGPMTEAAVQRWQARNGIVSSGSPDTTGYGYVGPRTRAALACGGQTTVQPSPTYTPPITSVTTPKKSSVLTPDQIKIISPANNTQISVGGNIGITYSVGSNIVAGDPAIIERSIVNANTDSVNSGYVPVTQSAGTYKFDWTPNEPGSYQALLKINLDNKQYSARSGIITVVGTPISTTDLLTPTVSVSVSPSSITAGQSSLLKWNSTNANRCVLKYGSSEENISVSGTKTVIPSETTTYLVWCVNDPGTGKDGPASSGSATVSVSTPTLQTPSVTFTASPSTIGAVQNSTLSWNTSNANRCILQYGSSEESVAVNGSKVVLPSQTTSYRLWCVNDPGTGKDGPATEKTVTVSVASPSCTLTTDKTFYQYGETIVLSWASQNATYATFWQDDSGKDHLTLPGDKLNTSGSHSVTANVVGNPSAKLLIYNYYGNNSCSVTIPVNQ